MTTITLWSYNTFYLGELGFHPSNHMILTRMYIVYIGFYPNKPWIIKAIILNVYHVHRKLGDQAMSVDAYTSFSRL